MYIGNPVHLSTKGVLHRNQNNIYKQEFTIENKKCVYIGNPVHLSTKGVLHSKNVMLLYFYNISFKSKK